MKILGIETSCDETGAAVIQAEKKQPRVKLLSNILTTSLSLHGKTGGIIPESAAREQIKYIIPVIQQALIAAKIKNPEKEIDAIAVTYGPGLIGSLLVGVETARTLAFTWNKPLIPVNHLFGHIYANWIEQNNLTVNPKAIQLPALALIVSGGHTDLVLIKEHGTIQWLGGTRDDAAGECFDKSARLLGYHYPGGPKIAELAKKGNPKTFDFPRPMIASQDYEFSFSGLKTSFLNMTKQFFPILRTNPGSKVGWQQVVLEHQLSQKEKQTLYDLCASLQEAIIDVLVKKTLKAAKQYNVKSILLSGGVASNQTLREKFTSEIEQKKIPITFFVPEKHLCTDNAAMIATAGFYNYTEQSWQRVTANPELYFD